MRLSPLQQAEYRLLCRAVTEASALLADGKPAVGYQCLLAGLERARELAALGERWAEDLADSYRSALFYYTFLYPASRQLPLSRPGSQASQ